MPQLRTAFVLVLLAGCSTYCPVDTDPEPHWERLPTEPAQDRQDDVSFVDEDTGWYVNSLGKIFKTIDGGTTWKTVVNMPGTYWRAIAFLDARHGFAGNLGPGAVEGFRTVMTAADFENLNRQVTVTDRNLIYETRDGGATWKPVPDLQSPGGICSINVLVDGVGRKSVWAGGRVTGPARVFQWTGGERWETWNLATNCAMVLDVHFFDKNMGIVCAATEADPAVSFASILRTENGGATWTEVYRSSRRGESVWKCSFPTRDTGYATIRSFSADPASTERFVVKTVDGGRTWKEILVVDDFHSRPQGIGFLTADRGWVGTTSLGFETRDGGASWTRVDLGRSINRFRFIRSRKGGTVVYAIGQDLCRLRIP